MSDFIEKDQEKFFNLNANRQIPRFDKNIFFNYVNKEQFYSFSILKNSIKILDYGVGIGICIDAFLEVNKDSKVDYKLYGVDIAENAINVVSKKYPKHEFYKIFNNQMPQIKDSSLDACYMMHVLHHSREHREIFEEIYKKLSVGGYFIINDLSSNNFFVKLGRFLFPLTPKFVKKKI